MCVVGGGGGREKDTGDFERAGGVQGCVLGGGTHLSLVNRTARTHLSKVMSSNTLPDSISISTTVSVTNI